MAKYLTFFFIAISTIALCLLINYSNQDKQNRFIENNLTSEYVKQKTQYSSQYGTLTQESKNLSLSSLSCNESNDCNAIINLDSKKINTKFSFEKTSFYLPMISEFNGKITNVVFK